MQNSRFYGRVKCGKKVSNITGLVLAVRTVFSYHIPYCASKQSENANGTKNIDLFFRKIRKIRKSIRGLDASVCFSLLYSIECGGKSGSAE